MIRFHFIADELCLDFINTEAVQQDDRVDLLDSFDDLMAWYVEAGVVDAAAFRDSESEGLPRVRDHERRRPSLPESNASVAAPGAGASFLRKLFAFGGPGYLVAVGYMDPGNWATDIAAGSRYGYTLLYVIMASNLMAILLQSLALRLGIASEQDLAQACRNRYSRPVTIALWLFAEIAIAACDLAEVIGSAIALQLLFHIPLTAGVIITSLDVLVILLLEHRGEPDHEDPVYVTHVAGVLDR